MCSTDPFQFRWLKGYIHSSCCYHHQIGSINISNCYHMFCGCVPEMLAISYSWKTGILFSLLMHSLWLVQIVGYDLACRSNSFVVHCTISSSSLCKLLWRQWTYKVHVIYILSSLWVRISIFSQLSVIQYVGLCVSSLPIPLMMIEKMYILCLIIIIKSEVWIIIHCLGLGHETMVCAVCLSILLWYALDLERRAKRDVWGLIQILLSI